MLSREEYVAVCETCIKREFNSKKGIVCSLTKEHADFEDTCLNFEEDPLAIDRKKRMEKHKDQMLTRQLSRENFVPTLNKNRKRGPFAVERNMMNGSAGTGILMIIGGLVWLFLGLQSDYIFYYPIFLVIGGVIVLIKSGIKKAQEIQRPDTSDILDDKNDIDVF